MRHKYKIFKTKHGQIKIDRDIAPIISKMWELGIMTTACCQQTCCHKLCKHKTKIKKYKDSTELWSPIKNKLCKKHAWIVFDRPADAQKFFNIVAEFSKDDDSMYAHMHGYDLKKNPSTSWIIDSHLENLGVFERLKKVKLGLASGKKKGARSLIREEVSCPKNDFNISVQLFFPRKHIKYVEEKLNLALTKSK